jgi:phage FluMu protein Com
MPIDFRCTRCQKLLRVADHTTGRQAVCPQCGEVLTVPAPSTPGAPAWSSVAPEGEPPPATRPSDFDTDNPFASPTYTGQAAASQPYAGARAGPPWERDGASASSFMETVKQAYGDASRLFREMRLDGGLGGPLGFAVIGGLIGAAFQIAYNILVELALGRAANMGQQLLGLTCGVIVFPLLLVLTILIFSVVNHLFLMMVGGANASLEATIRVNGYTSGATYLLYAIPLVGGLAAMVAYVVIAIIGLARAHETSLGRSAFAVLVPTALCVAACAGVMFWALFMIAQGPGGAGGPGFGPF